MSNILNKPMILALVLVSAAGVLVTAAIALTGRRRTHVFALSN